MSTLQDTVISAISTRFNVAEDRIGPDTTFQDLDFDSLSWVELSTVLEKDLGAGVHETEGRDLKTVSDLVELLAGKGIKL
jgi:acyl carrier protein